jgi:hypothetical protein
MVRQLERDLPELLYFFRASAAPVAEAAHHQCDCALIRRAAPTNVADGRVHQHRRRIRINYAIFSRFNEDWKALTLKLFTQAA